MMYIVQGAYHHLSINIAHQTYLGFSWNKCYYQFTVLPFGISCASYIFTKVCSVLTKHWRKQGLNVLMYLDDGIAFASSRKEAFKIGAIIREDIIKSGFLIAEEKSCWSPSQNVEWLGFTWNSLKYKVSVNEDKIEQLSKDLDSIIAKVNDDKLIFKARHFASLLGKIVSTNFVTGGNTSLYTRYMNSCLNGRASWNACIKIDSKAFNEIIFWRTSIKKVKR